MCSGLKTFLVYINPIPYVSWGVWYVTLYNYSQNNVTTHMWDFRSLVNLYSSTILRSFSVTVNWRRSSSTWISSKPDEQTRTMNFGSTDFAIRRRILLTAALLGADTRTVHLFFRQMSTIAAATSVLPVPGGPLSNSFTWHTYNTIKCNIQLLEWWIIFWS